MHAAFTRAVGQTGIFAGQIWRIPDSLMTFADADPAKRTIHPDRPVLVVQGDDYGDNARCPTVLVLPLSSDTSRQRPWEDLLSGGETPLTAPSIVKVHLIQPLPRTLLLRDGIYEGDIAEAALIRVFAHLVSNLGLVP